MSYSQQPLSQLIGIYLTKRRLRWSHREQTGRVIRYLIECVGDIEVSQMDYARAEDFQAFLTSFVSLESVNSYVKTISPVFSWAVRRAEFGLKENPFLSLKSYKTPEPDIRVYTKDELRSMLMAAASDMQRGRILAAVTAGLRHSEVLNLTFKDVDFERQIITVRPKKKTTETWPWTPKNYEKRHLPLVSELHSLLIKIMMDLPAGYPYPFLTEKRYWTLRSRIGTIPERVRVCPDENYKPFRRILKAANISDGSFHDLRRTAITNWSKSLPPKDVQTLAGHADIQTTLKYYVAVSQDYIESARQVSTSIGVTGIEPATS